MTILKRRAFLTALLATSLSGGLLAYRAVAAEKAVMVPAPEMAEPAGDVASEKIVLAGGCFWGVQGVFQHVKGVTNAVSGYAGGKADTAKYDLVSNGDTGHAESVEITFDPKVVNLATLLQIYFSVVHDPTQLNYQGPDEGTQYRSAIFPFSDAQAKVAQAYIDQLDKAKVFKAKIVTTLEPGKTFYPAEDYHQDYLTLNPHQPYIAYNDIPKVENLSKVFPQLYSEKPKLVKG
ncbi:peptide-methionine (S)-S-oxide reductase MsrA [Aestuariivirga litoralis]|uniref:peptide-methionine (S)-S-oxide reductase MsrA n=1 Tax=Aestuariivirga litoralis TaxID=2650924 RepID=UPI0018C71607|nr:peptide-methionine (S)-S-oxide reductase MsrA [Aestuariivirga litoralis]MBG1231423.1 peptide-methionine (S)-S-oxide reductase MsrA [Aestuariivirga litoralis]